MATGSIASDIEIIALETCVKALTPLPDDQVHRVIRYGDGKHRINQGECRCHRKHYSRI